MSAFRFTQRVRAGRTPRLTLRVLHRAGLPKGTIIVIRTRRLGRRAGRARFAALIGVLSARTRAARAAQQQDRTVSTDVASDDIYDALVRYSMGDWKSTDTHASKRLDDLAQQDRLLRTQPDAFVPDPDVVTFGDDTVLLPDGGLADRSEFRSLDKSLTGAILHPGDAAIGKLAGTVSDAFPHRFALPALDPPPEWTCSGNEVTVFDNTNGEGIRNGGRAPIFHTLGAFCVTAIQTYHWNDGHGVPGGELSLLQIGLSDEGESEVGPMRAQTSSGQNDAPNVNWFAHFPTSPDPWVISGVYSCEDSDPATWSSNRGSNGDGFCIVRGIPAVRQR